MNSSPNTFAGYYRASVIRPKTTFANLLQDKNALRFAMIAVSVTAILYTFVYIFLILGGGQPFKPWLNIPENIYYHYNVFFCAPSMFLGWILASGVTHLVSRLFTTAGRFEQVLCVFAFGISISSWTTGAHDLVTSFLGAFHFISQHDYELKLNSPTVWRTLLWILMVAYLVWFIVLFSVGVKSVYKLRAGQSFLLGVVRFVIYQLFFLIFNR